MPAMSSARPTRLSGVESAICSPKDSRVARIILEGKAPGAIALTVINGASRPARCRVSWCTAAFDAEYE